MLRTWFEAISEVMRSWQCPIDLFVPPLAGALCPCQPPGPYQTSAASPQPRCSQARPQGGKTQGRALKRCPWAIYQLGCPTPDLGGGGGGGDVMHLQDQRCCEKQPRVGQLGQQRRTPSPRNPTVAATELRSACTRGRGTAPGLSTKVSQARARKSWTLLSPAT